MPAQSVDGLFPPDPAIGGVYIVTDGQCALVWMWHPESQLWEGGPSEGMDICTPEVAAVMGYKLAHVQ